ncbi:cobaltochelatase CobT-related protein [Klebsiella grimontii]|uniref:cobaltochelatase CobT-related protein n=1 Tax=Klebsiella grimontii TaxID=2058152 RepID=UPI0012B7B30A|nr:hypothetical protein [Klebsiella grimontii]
MKKASVSEIVRFREAVKKIVSMLVDRDIPVIERGAKAYVQYNKKTGEPVLICIPSIPDDASDKFLMAIRGFIDHEVAHVLFTDGMAGRGYIWNAVEDTYIERKMGQMFKGSKANLINTQRHVIDTVFVPKESEAIAEKKGDATRMFLEFYLVPVLRSWSGQLPFVDFMADRWDRVKEPVSLLLKHDVDKMIPNIKSTSDSVAVAAKIVQLLVDKPMKRKEKDETPPPEPEDDHDDEPEDGAEPEPEVGDEPEDGAEPGDESDSEDDAEPEPEDDGESEHEEPETPDPDSLPWGDDSEDDDDDSGSGDGDDTEDGDGIPGAGDGDSESDDGDGEEFEDGEEEFEGGGGDSGASTGSGDIPAPSKEDLDLLESTELPEGAEDMSMEGAMTSIIASESELSTGYRPYERTFDFMGKLEDASETIRNIQLKNPSSLRMYGDPSHYQVFGKHESVFEKKIRPLIAGDIVATLAKDLERAIASKNRTQFIPGQRRGKIHGPSLHRLTLNDDRVFRKKDIRRAVNSCVQIVVDMSGSMRGENKIETACAAAYTLADALSRINVKTMITGFTTYTTPVPGTSEFNRSEALFLPIIKTWEAPVSGKQTMLNMGAVASTMILAENIDGESILALLQHFSDRQEDRKIMLVLSDGMPQSQGRGLVGHLKQATKQIEEESDIHLMGIGIMTTAPRNYYRDNICLSSVGDLSETLIKQMQRLLS